MQLLDWASVYYVNKWIHNGCLDMNKNNMIFSGKQYITAAYMVFILVISTACQSETKQSIVSKPAEVAPFKPVVVAEGAMDTKGDGVKEMIRIWMMDGKEITNTEPGSFQGTFLTGEFEAVAERDGKELARLGLNDAFDGGEMSFRKALSWNSMITMGTVSPNLLLGKGTTATGVFMQCFQSARAGLAFWKRTSIPLTKSRPFGIVKQEKQRFSINIMTRKKELIWM
jgi:hypothetical protein